MTRDEMDALILAAQNAAGADYTKVTTDDRAAFLAGMRAAADIVRRGCATLPSVIEWDIMRTADQLEREP